MAYGVPTEGDISISHASEDESFVATLTLCFQNVGFCRAVEDHARRPNIVVILADDLGYGHLAC